MDETSKRKTAKDYFETPEQAAERNRLMALPFRMVIQDVFNVKGRGVIVTGRVETGLLEKGDAVFISGGDVPLPTTVIGIEMFSPSGMAWAGDNVGLLLLDVEINYIKRDMLVTKQDE